MKKYILAVMLVLVVSPAFAGDIDAPVYYFRPSVLTQTAPDQVSDFARKNNLDKLNCVNCNKRGGLYVDGAALYCTKCSIPSLTSEYKNKSNEFCVGQKVWDVFEGRGTIEGIKEDFPEKSMSIAVRMDNGNKRWYYLNGTYYKIDEIRRLYPTTTNSINFTLDNLFPEKKQERLLVRELIGTETAGLRCNKFVVSATKYNCILCGNLLGIALGNGNYFCPECKKYFNIEKGK